ncbi:MAG: hypothetical protein WCS65_08935 [Verrucomicrobiae bacterium]
MRSIRHDLETLPDDESERLDEMFDGLDQGDHAAKILRLADHRGQIDRPKAEAYSQMERAKVASIKSPSGHQITPAWLRDICREG